MCLCECLYILDIVYEIMMFLSSRYSLCDNDIFILIFILHYLPWFVSSVIITILFLDTVYGLLTSDRVILGFLLTVVVQVISKRLLSQLARLGPKDFWIKLMIIKKKHTKYIFNRISWAYTYLYQLFSYFFFFSI